MIKQALCRPKIIDFENKLTFFNHTKSSRYEKILSNHVANTLDTQSNSEPSFNTDAQYNAALNGSKAFSSDVEKHLNSRLMKEQQVIKRVIESCMAILALLLLGPAFACISLGIYLDDPGPVLYKSTRIGKAQAPFMMYKFRTMRVHANAQRDALRAETGQHGQLFKMQDDPRVTRLGRLLRRFSLDETPQLLNIVRGEMSLTGPRPLPADESQLFLEPFSHRFDVLPGLTGIWQVKGRSNTTFNQLCLLELDYLLNWNLLEDLKILSLTIPAVLNSKGAY